MASVGSHYMPEIRCTPAAGVERQRSIMTKCGARPDCGASIVAIEGDEGTPVAIAQDAHQLRELPR